MRPDHVTSDRTSTERVPTTVARLVAVACLVWAVVLYLRPSDLTSTIARLVGVGLVLLGLAFALRSRSGPAPLADRVDAAVWIAIGVGAIVWPDPTVRAVAIAVGVGLLVTGIVEFGGALRASATDRLLLGLGGVSSFGFGVAALVWPSVTTLVLTIVVAARLVIAGVDLLVRTITSVPATTGRRWWRGTRIVVAVIGVLAAGAASFVAVAVHRAQPGPLGAFYDPPADLPDEPGVLIRQELVSPFVDGAVAYRVLYTTTDNAGAVTTSSGLVIVPEGPAPAGGRPVLAFNHGTVGIARQCALSALPGDQYGPAIPGIREFLDAGFVIAATDYAGLGSDAVTEYLVGRGQAYSALDAVRVAVSMPEAEAAPRFVAFGESQGGQASLFTGQYAEAYAPELELAGVAAAAPATDLTELFRENVDTTFGIVLASYALASWERVYDVSITDIAVPQAVPVIRRLAGLCIQNPSQILAVFPESELLKIGFLAAPPWETEPWASLLEENTPGSTVIAAPVLVAQGADDPLVLPPVQAAFVDRWCANGQSIEYRMYDGVGHLDAGHASAADVAAWAQQRFAGEAWSPTC